MDDATYQKCLQTYSLETLNKVLQNVNRDKCPVRVEWISEEISARENGVEPIERNKAPDRSDLSDIPNTGATMMPQIPDHHLFDSLALDSERYVV